MSKIVTISVVMDLVEDGILDLNDPVTKYIPEFEQLKVAVNVDGLNLYQVERAEEACPFHLVQVDSVMTVLHLINHQAGFYYATTNIPCLDIPLNEKNLPLAENSRDLINRLAELPLIQQPGSGYYYGTNTTVLGIVAERATQKSLEQLVEERLTGPVGINGLQYSVPPNVTLLPSISGRDSTLREALPGELDIFGPDVPDYDPAHELYLGGEGMLATADGYTDFLRMLLLGGELNGYRFLEKSSIETMTAPHTQTDSPWGYNGFNLWVTGDTLRQSGWGEAGLWQGGGYEGTQFWVDPKRGFVGVVMSQVNYIPPGGGDMYNDFRGSLYRQFWRNEH
jgi:CubicO group peptidase (beta-lactamase class C family)